MLRFRTISQISLSCLLATGAAALALDAAPVAAQSSATGQRSFDIPAMPLSEAMRLFMQQSGIQVSYASGDGANVRTSAVKGDLAPAAALSHMLAGTGLTYRFATPTSVILEKAPHAAPGAISLGPVRVEGAGGRNGFSTSGTITSTLTEGTASYATRQVEVGGKTARELREIPQSVSVVTAQRIRDQAITTTEDALRQATGVTVIEGAGYPLQTFTSRGFQMDVQSDGGASNVSYFWGLTGLPDLALLDHVEVLRGSDGLFTGSGKPGGTVNLVRKRPLDHAQVAVELLAGSWDRYRGQVDVTGPIAWDGRLRARLVGAAEDREFFHRPSAMDKFVGYGVLEADLSPTTLLTAGISHERRDTTGSYAGVPRSTTGADLGLPRSACLCTNWSGRTYRTTELFLRLEQAIGDDWKAKINLTRQKLGFDLDGGHVTGSVDPVTGLGAELAGDRTSSRSLSKLADASIDGNFSLFGMKHDLLVGANLQDVFTHYYGESLYDFDARPPVNVFAFDPGGFPRPPLSSAAYQPFPEFGGQKQLGIYATLRSHLTNKLSVSGGARYSTFEYIFLFGGERYKESGIWTPYASIVFDATKAISIYASYTSIYESQGNIFSSSGETLPPVRGKTFELGAKASWLDGRLTGSLAVYKISRVNSAVLDFESPNLPACCYTAATEEESKGVDAELTGEIQPGWQISIGYTYNRNKLKRGHGESDGNVFETRTPRHLFKLWTMAELPGSLSDWRIGAGVNAQSRSYNSGEVCDGPRDDDRSCISGNFLPYEFEQKAYAVVNMRLEHRINTKWSAAINANNIFDKTYYQTAGTADDGNYYGEPRNVLFTLSGTF